MPELDAQNRPLNSLHAIVVALANVMIFALLTPVPKHADGAGVIIMIGDHDAALPIRSQVFARVKTEAAEITDAADPAALVPGAMSLTGVLNDGQIVPAGEWPNGSHIRP